MGRLQLSDIIEEMPFEIRVLETALDFVRGPRPCFPLAPPRAPGALQPEAVLLPVRDLATRDLSAAAEGYGAFACNP